MAADDTIHIITGFKHVIAVDSCTAMNPL